MVKPEWLRKYANGQYRSKDGDKINEDSGAAGAAQELIPTRSPVLDNPE